MDPIIDEKLVLTVSSTFSEMATEQLQVTAVREAYGQNRNEGLCYEFCAGIPFSGEIAGELFVCLDNFSKILLLPYIMEAFEVDPGREALSDALMRAFVERIAEEFKVEVSEFVASIELQEIRSLNHKIVPLPDSDFRKYTVVYFLRDDQQKKYLGRIYLHLMVSKKEEYKLDIDYED